MGPTKRRLPQCLADLSQRTYEEHLSRKPNIPVITLQVSLAGLPYPRRQTLRVPYGDARPPSQSFPVFCCHSQLSVKLALA